jgi:hypothetical protein
VTYPGQGGQWQPDRQQPYGYQPTAAYPAYYPPQGPPPPPRRSRRGLAIGIVIAVLVVAGGTAATVWALNRGTQAGSPTPQAAIEKLATDVSNGDLLGIQSDVAPAESSALKDITADGTNQMKRLRIESPGYNPQSPAVNATAGLSGSGLTIDDNAAQTINDHLVINKVVGGTITLSPKLDGNMFTQQFLKAAFPGGLPRQHPNTIDIGAMVRQTGQPVRIAAIKVGGGWYTSVFYTAADYALESARQPWPTSALPATGAASPDAAVTQFADALLRADYRTAIQLTDPSEMAVLHDAGPAILDALHKPKPTGVAIAQIRFTDKPVSGGVDVVVQSATLTKGADSIQLSQSGDCYAVTDKLSGEQRKLCSDAFVNGQDTAALKSELDDLPPAVATALQHLTSGILSSGVGLVSSEVNGKWYVSPVRSAGALLVAMVGGLQPADITALIGGGH